MDRCHHKPAVPGGRQQVVVGGRGVLPVGDAVAAGDALLVIESMKLQTTISAAIDGDVGALPVAPGEGFEQGAVLVRIEVPNHEEPAA